MSPRSVLPRFPRIRLPSLPICCVSMHYVKSGRGCVVLVVGVAAATVCCVVVLCVHGCIVVVVAYSLCLLSSSPPLEFSLLLLNTISLVSFIHARQGHLVRALTRCPSSSTRPFPLRLSPTYRPTSTSCADLYITSILSAFVIVISSRRTFSSTRSRAFSSCAILGGKEPFVGLAPHVL